MRSSVAIRSSEKNLPCLHSKAAVSWNSFQPLFRNTLSQSVDWLILTKSFASHGLPELFFFCLENTC
jgi:hypothetical protein